MPRRSAVIRRRFTEGMEILDCETELSLVEGEGIIGTALQLRTREDWQREWLRWRSIVLPKCLKHRPGLRPFALYVIGDLPEPPLQQPPPAENRLWRLYVPAADGTGRWHHRYGEPWQRSEVLHLRDIGEVDRAEYRRYLRWRRDCKACGCPKSEYPLEQGSYV